MCTRTKQSKIILISLLFTQNLIEAQDTEQKNVTSDNDELEGILTDRPDQTEASQLTPKGWFQMESGLQTEVDETSTHKTQSTIFNSTLWKYGLTESLELRLITEFGEDKSELKGAPRSTKIIRGWYPLAIGSKIKIHQGKGLVPAVSLITHLDLPILASANYRPNFTIPRFRFCLSHDLSNKISFSYNLGGEWEDGASNMTFIYTASLAFELHKNIGMFVESYGFARECSPADHRLDGGFTFLLSNNLQLDTSAGIGLNDIAPNYFISAGASWRFNAFDYKRTFKGKLKKLNQ